MCGRSSCHLYLTGSRTLVISLQRQPFFRRNSHLSFYHDRSGGLHQSLSGFLACDRHLVKKLLIRCFSRDLHHSLKRNCLSRRDLLDHCLCTAAVERYTFLLQKLCMDPCCLKALRSHNRMKRFFTGIHDTYLIGHSLTRCSGFFVCSFLYRKIRLQCLQTIYSGGVLPDHFIRSVLHPGLCFHLVLQIFFLFIQKRRLYIKAPALSGF